MIEVEEKQSVVPYSERRGSQPCFVDGRCSTKTYVVVASKVENEEDKEPGAQVIKNLIGIRKLNDDSYRWHCYPNWAHYGMGQPMMGTHGYHNHAHNYDSHILNAEHTQNLINALHGQRGLNLAPKDQILKVLARGYKIDSDHTEHVGQPRVKIVADPNDV